MNHGETYHVPVLLNESIGGLNISPEGVYLDLTYGGGGHSREILKKINNGRLIGFDQDADAESNVLDDDRFIFVKSDFRYLKNFMRYYKFSKVDGIIADLGISSHQINVAYRGFSFRSDASIDMRMNTSSKFSASDLLREYTQKDLIRVLREYGEISNAKKLAEIIVNYRRKCEIKSTGQLVELIKPCAPERIRNKYMAKVFQALRYEVTGEINSLKKMILQLPEIIKTGGRVVIISYNSIEDKLVKNFFKYGRLTGEAPRDIYGNYSVPFAQINKRVIVPDAEELKSNPRSRSAKLRIAERI